MKKIKVLEVEITKNMGGVESLLCNITKKIDKTRFQIDFISSGNADYQKELLNMGSHIYLMPSISEVIRYKKQFDKVLDNGYDIVHFNKNSLANSLPIFWAHSHRTHPKIIIHSHNTAPTHNSRLLYLLNDINKHIDSNKADYKIACSSEARDWMFTKKSEVEIINNGINLKKFAFSVKKRNEIRKQLHVNPETLLIGNVGRFNKQKNHTEIVKIFNEILKIKPDAKLLLIGKGEEEKLIHQMIADRNISDSVIFVQFTSEVDKYLSAMDVFLMPSLYEGLPIAAVEAQAAGLDVFISDTISKETMLTSCIHQFSLKDSPQKIASLVLNRLNSNAELREEQAKAVKNKGFDLEDTISRIQEIYMLLSE